MSNVELQQNGTFLIDFENIGESGLKWLIEQIKTKNANLVVIFYSESNKSITLDTMKDFVELDTKIEIKKVKVGGKNALDFQLSSYLGYLIGIYENLNYYIVSNDKGFDYVLSFWKETNIKRLKTNDSKVEKSVEEQTINVENKIKLLTMEEIRTVLTENDMPKVVLNIFNKYKNKRDIANQIQKHCRNSNKTGQIYRKLKPLLKKYNKN